VKVDASPLSFSYFSSALMEEAVRVKGVNAVVEEEGGEMEDGLDGCGDSGLGRLG